MEMQEKKENQKTIIYVLVAGMALLVAWEPWRPAPPDHSAPAEVGAKLFADFKDPLAAKSLEVTKFDEDTATIRPFKVAQIDGVWSIPSHSNYPADAQDHMAAAATSLLDLTILGEVSRNAGDQELYGVITPDPKTLSQGATGVGTRITLRDDKDKVLADLVIGKPVKDQPALRYVREEGRDPIYTVAIKTDQLSTKFEDWIEEDLLKLNAFDVRNVELNDYSLEEGLTQDGKVGLRMNPRSKAKLAFDDAKSNWSLVEMTEFDEKQEGKPAQLAENEELNAEKLNALKSALDDLKIVDVERKPKGLSQDLRASEELVKDAETQGSLIARGFYPVPVEDHLEIFSSEGEATCTTKDGVRYVLRFGRLAGDTSAGEDKEEATEGEQPKSDPALNRYLFVMAQFDESQIPKPQFEPVPGEPPAEGQPDADKPADAADEDKAEKPAAEKPAAEAPAEKTKPQSTSEPPVPETKTADEVQADGKAAQEAAPAEAPKPDEPKEAESKSQEQSTDDQPAADQPAETKPAAPTPEEQQKVAVERENKRRQEEYDDAIKKGQDKVKELNDRFADWYFIISDDVYKKVHLGRGDIVKVKVVEDAVKDLGNPEVNELQKGLDGQ
ncbi:MAG: DUF4340 domain-containing protein [Pirellulales bacterium]